VAVTTSAGHYTAGRLVVCAGPWARQLIPQLARLAVPERQVLIWTQALEPELFTADRFPVFVLDVDGESYYGFPIHDVPGFKLGRYHHLREPIDPDDPDRAAGTDDEALLRTFIDRCFPAASGPTLMLKTCIFTNSPDEHFLVGELPSDAGVVVAAGFSGHGYKFCSVIGEVLADLVIDGRTRHDIGLFRLDRFG
jgi:sarcosine oxidase